MSTVFNVRASVLGKQWQWRGGVAPDAGGDGAGGIDALVEQLFRARGAVAQDFSRLRAPTIRDWLPDPSIFRDMDVAARRVADAVKGAQAIVVFGDYDVDGATSAAVLVRLIRQLGGTVSTYIPDRLLEGYGPSADAMRALKGAGAELVITVDCGTQGFDALSAACDAGLDVIVVDHHRASTELPRCVAVVNPNRLDEEDGAAFGHLAAVGVAFLLAVAVVRTLRAEGFFAARPEPKLMDLLDIVALGTVADVVPLTGLNRAFVAQGLKVMAARRNPGLNALIAVSGIERAPACHDLGFALGPRINAGGRVGRADLGVRLLTTDDPQEATALAAELDALNVERRAIEAEVTEEALARAAEAGGAVAVIAGEGWHPGVVGIVASRVKDRLHRPVIILSVQPDGSAKGSGRSVPGVDLGGAVLAAKERGLLIAGGGHAMAAGVTVAPGGIPAFAAFLNERCASEVAGAGATASLMMDAAVSPRGVCVDLCEALDGAGPYGQGWPQPRVASGPWTILECKVVGEAHVRVVAVAPDGARVKAMAFRSADAPLGAALVAAGRRPIYLAGRVKRDDWGRTPAAELHLDDIAFAD
ncbi:single-stranded-DNA-specific exonuclease RecJ [Glacieibacterium frigidum]|uniref:Single-stranded-DNA-specific exonuclease RecJ n=1 Tax=Glacieibacterium frigidum TaxID=2593303 RepID=A0A552UAD4_9SPHN|nr:single-stranded-DNA-specific exonuclease RecJ [Glacieibacterium frigidum]TRW15176.1 single-stranded-DNA-specific exonuclease RecJ [Glacieibacterium frigidum]